MKFIKTTDDNVAIHPKKRVERLTTSGIIMPAQIRDPFVIWGEVLGIGPGHLNKKGEPNPTTLRKGDKVLYLREGVRHTFEDVEIDNKTYDAVSFVQERDINLYVREEKIYALNDYIIGKIIPYESAAFTFEFQGQKIRMDGKMSEGGLILPDFNEKEKEEKELRPIRVRVTHVGPGRYSELGVPLPVQVQVGDVIMVPKAFAWEFVLDEKDKDSGFVVVKEDQIHGIEATS